MAVSQRRKRRRTQEPSNGLELLLNLGRCLVTDWLQSRDLFRLAMADTTGRKAVDQPDVWGGRALDLGSPRLHSSAQLLGVLGAAAGRWSRVVALTMPQCQPSMATAVSLRGVLPALRSLDLRRCPRAGGQRLLKLLAGLKFLEQVTLPGYLPPVPLPHLKTLEFTNEGLELHREGPKAWAKLSQLAPRLEVLRAPWLDDDRDGEVSQEMWEKLHEPPLGCRTSDACMRELHRLPALRELDLRGVYTLTSTGLGHLAEGCASLVLLNLSRQIDDQRQRRMALSRADVDAFQRKRPNTTVLFA